MDAGASDDISDIAAYYDLSIEAEEMRLDQHPIEFDITWRYLCRYLPATGTILEVGAATGRYTLALCRRGYTVTAVDLSPALLERCRARLAAEGLDRQARLVMADARDLSALPDIPFDAVLLMGPLYHLIAEADRRAAVQQAVSRLRPGGVLFSTFLSRLGVLGDLLRRTPAWIEGEADVQSHLTDGHRPHSAPRGGFRGYFARMPEIRALHEACGLDTLTAAGVEPAVGAHDEDYNTLPPAQRAAWLDLLFAISAEESIVGASRHILYIGRKV